MPIEVASMADIQFEDEIEWDGKNLSVWATTHFGRVLCEIPRDTIHMLSIYNDATEREIKRDRQDIFERLRPALVAKIVQNALDAVSVDSIPLSAEDLNGRLFCGASHTITLVPPISG
jgi:hypothetical protein